MSDLHGVPRRIRELANDGETVLGHARMSETDEGEYHLVLREYQHPEHDGLRVVNVRYAYLTAGDGSDGWLDNGVNIRVEEDSADTLQALAQLFASGIPRLGGGQDPAYTDLLADEED